MTSSPRLMPRSRRCGRARKCWLALCGVEQLAGRHCEVQSGLPASVKLLIGTVWCGVTCWSARNYWLALYCVEQLAGRCGIADRQCVVWSDLLTGTKLLAGTMLCEATCWPMRKCWPALCGAEVCVSAYCNKLPVYF